MFCVALGCVVGCSSSAGLSGTPAPGEGDASEHVDAGSFDAPPARVDAGHLDARVTGAPPDASAGRRDATGDSAADAGSTAARDASDAGGMTTASPEPTGVSGTWQLIFDDEFAGTSLDTSKWATGWFGTGITGGVGGSSEQDCYDPEQVTVASGELDLSLIAKTETCNGASEPYATGFITSNGLFSYTYGFLEARIWLPGTATIDNWPAFWADGQDWPQDGEDDVVEGLGGSACYHFHDPSGGPGGCASGTFTGGWHTFGSDWESGSVNFYYDGEMVGSVDSGITSAPMYLILGLGVGSPAVAPSRMRVDYVRVWQ